MKKLNYLLLGLAGLAMASCSQDDLLGTAANGDGNFTITVKLPGDLATRAELGDGLTADNLHFAVYDMSSGSPVFSFEDEAQFDNSLTTTVSLNLIAKKQYQLAFFACSPNAEIADKEVYTFKPDNTEGATPRIEVNYANMTGANNNADDYDCFFALTDTYTVGTSASPYEVTLTRPVAQINWGTSELNENQEIISTFGQDGEYIQTDVTVTGTVYNQFNILENAVAPGSSQTLNLFSGAGNQALIPEGTPFPVNPSTYDYVAVQYLLAPSSSDTYSLTLNINNGGNDHTATQSGNVAVNVLNAPVQANYRTNIYGNLLSTNAEFTVTKQDFFAGNYNQPYPEAWDGSKTYPMITSNPTTPVVIASPSDLAGLADMVNGKNLPDGVTDPTFDGYTFTLEADMDMGGNDFPMIGSGTRSSGKVSGNAFRGVFDGNGKTIKNLKITNTDANKASVVGFIPNLDGENAALKNVTFENVNIDGGASEQAGIVGTITNGASVSSVTVTDGSITSAEAAGAIAGRMIITGKISNCYNGTEAGTGATINGAGNVGGIVGASYYTSIDSDGMTIENCYNYGKVVNSGQLCGGIVGLSAATVTGCYNYGEIIGTSGVGGIVGEAVSWGGAFNCENRGDVSGTQYVGGICGWISYYTGDSYTATEIVKLEGNTNFANVTGTGGAVGGILGMSQNGGIVTGNTNNAPKLSAGSTVAGIAGNITHPGNNTQFNDGYITLTGNVNNTSLDDMSGTTKGFIYTGVAAEGSQSNDVSDYNN